MLQRVCAVISYCALAGLLAAPLLYFNDVLDKPAMKAAMAAATVVWFACGGVARWKRLSGE